MAGREDSIAVRNVLEGTLSADNAMATSVGTAFDPAYALVDEAGAQITLYINSSDYKMYAQLKDKSGNLIYTSNIIDLPLETMIVNGRYDSATKELILTLDNGNEIEIPLGDLISGLQSEITPTNMLSSDLVDDTNKTHKFITATERTSWNAKEDAANKVTSIDENSTDLQYPSAKYLYDDTKGEYIITNEVEEMTLNNTADAPMTLALKGNTSQASDPTPSTPVDVNVVSGDNTIEICGKNLFDKANVNWYRNNNTSWSNTTDTNTTRIRTSSFKLKGGKTYTISGIPSGINFMGAGEFAEYNGANIGSATKNDNTFTLDATANYVYLLFGGSNFDSSTNTLMANANIQIEEGNQSSTYQPYTGNSQLISLGVENLLNLTDRTTTLNGITATITNNQIVLNGTASAYTEIYVTLTAKTLSAGNYTLSINEISGSVSGNSGGNTLYNTLRTSSYTTINSIAYGVSTSNTRNFTSETTLGDLRISLSSGVKCTNYTYNLQLEKGSKANSYSPYGASYIELCKISTYQDYIYKDNDRWFLHKEIGKVVLDGTNNIFATKSGSTNNIMYSSSPINNIKKPSSGTVISNLLSTHNISKAPNTLYSNNTLGTGINTDGSICCAFGLSSSLTTKELANQWLENNNIIFYYPLATPTDTEITDSTLISQLNNLANARSYDTSTHITQNANDKPFIIEASAFKNTTKGNIEAVKENCKQIENNYATVVYVNDLIGNIDAALDAINGEEI